MTRWMWRPEVQELLSDTLRLIQQGSSLVGLSPMVVYQSCLPFIPKGTALYRVYGDMAMLHIGMERSEQWDPLLATCVGHPSNVNSVAFSCDGTQVASGSSDGIRI